MTKIFSTTVKMMYTCCELRTTQRTTYKSIMKHVCKNTAHIYEMLTKVTKFILVMSLVY